MEESARIYMQHLHAELAKSGWSSDARDAATALIQCIEIALDKREDLQPTDVHFTRELMETVNQGEADGFINQYALGWGRDSAEVIAIGSEEAYDPTPLNLAGWNCGCSVLWLCGGRADILRRIDDDAASYSRTDDLVSRCVTVHYSDFGSTPAASHTWGCLAEILVGSSDPAEWQACFRPPVAGERPRYGMGDLCYQIEASAYPAHRAGLGRRPTRARVQFLTDFMASARSTAKVLLFHGGAYAGTPREDLTETFLEKRYAELPEVDGTPRLRIWRAERLGSE